MASYEHAAFGQAHLLLDGNALVYGGFSVPDRAPAAVRGQSSWLASLSSPDWFVSGEGQFYGQEHTKSFAKNGFSIGLQTLRPQSIHRLSIGQSFRTTIWHELKDIPQAEREIHGVESAILCYEYLRVKGIQLNFGLSRQPDWIALKSRPFERAGIFNRTAWQWPGQENSRFGFGVERDQALSHRSLSVLFENQGFNGQTLSTEYVRRKNATGLLIISLKPPENQAAATQAVLTIHKNKTWQFELDRQHTAWKYVISHMKLEFKRELNEGFKTTLIAGIGGKI